MKNFLFGVFLSLFITIKAFSSQELESVLVIGSQKSYFEDFSSTSLKSEFNDRQNPYSSLVIKNQLIEDLQAQRIEDTYDYTTGVTKAGKRADSIIIRGFEVDLQNIQVNGMPGLISTFGSPTTANIERIEIVKGAASVLYGNMKAGGFVNIQTKKPQAQNKVIFESSFQTYMSNKSNFAKNNGVATTLDATGSLKNNLFYRFITVYESYDSYRDNINEKNFHLYPSFLWNIDETSSLLVALEYGKEKGSADDGLFVANKNINTAASINTVYQEKDDFDNDEGKAFNLNYDNFINDKLSYNLSLRSVWHEDERKLYENRKVNNALNVENTTLTRRNRHQYNKRDWHSLDTNFKYDINTGKIRHNLITGLSLNYRKTDFDRKIFGNNVSSNINIYNPIYGASATKKEGTKRKTLYKSAGIYLQDKLNITNDFTLVASTRLDKTKIDFFCQRGNCNDNNTTQTSNLVGSLGGIYNLNEIVSFYTSYGQNYDPTTAERVDSSGNGLDSEKAEQIEIGTKLNLSEKLNTSLSLYKVNKENVAQLDNLGYYELKGEVESKGYEVDIQWLPISNWQIKTGYSYNKSKYISGKDIGNIPSNTPKITTYMFSRYNFAKKIYDGKLGISAGIVYKDKIYTSSSSLKAVELPSFTRYDLGLHYDFKDWNFSLNVENLTDKKYYESGIEDYKIAIGEPRKITFNLKKTF